MARATATWTNTVKADWQPGQLLKVTNFKQQVLQNTEHISQTHNHDAATAHAGGPPPPTDGKDTSARQGGAGRRPGRRSSHPRHHGGDASDRKRGKPNRAARTLVVPGRGRP